LSIALCVSGTRCEYLSHLLHSNICCECRTIALVDLRVALRIVVLVLW
jgi:hypothetical protein